MTDTTEAPRETDEERERREWQEREMEMEDAYRWKRLTRDGVGS